MKLRELIDELNRKNISLEDFEIVHITPCVRFEKVGEGLIEVIESFGIEFERKDEQGGFTDGRKSQTIHRASWVYGQ